MTLLIAEWLSNDQYCIFRSRIVSKREPPEPPPDRSAGSKTSEGDRDHKCLGVASERRQVRWGGQVNGF